MGSLFVEEILQLSVNTGGVLRYFQTSKASLKIRLRRFLISQKHQKNMKKYVSLLKKNYYIRIINYE